MQTASRKAFCEVVPSREEGKSEVDEDGAINNCSLDGEPAHYDWHLSNTRSWDQDCAEQQAEDGQAGPVTTTSTM